MATMTQPLRHPHPHLSQKPKSYVLSFLLRAAAMTAVSSCFFLFVGAASILLLLVRLRPATTAPRRRPRLTKYGESRLSSDDLRRLPRIRYAAPESAESTDDCVVCLSNLVDGDWCRILPDCGHKFHADCIDKWLMKAPACPICRCRVQLTGDSTGAAASSVEDSKLMLGLVNLR